MRKEEKLNAEGFYIIRDISREVAHRNGITINEADDLVRSVFDTIKDALYNKKVVQIAKFGVFFLHRTTGQVKRTPLGDKVFIASSLIPKFRFISNFRTLIKRMGINANQGKETND